MSTSSHVAAFGGGVVAQQKLTTLLTGVHGLSADRADAASFCIMAAGLGIYILVQWWLTWQEPTAPKLPMFEEKEITLQSSLSA